MPRKKKEKELDTDLDVLIVQAWASFKDKLQTRLDLVDSMSVDLAFESSRTDKDHHQFSVDEIVFISDVTITPLGQVRFEVPYGSRTKSFSYDESELILVKEDGYDCQLQVIVDKLVTECFDKVGDINSIDSLSEKYLQNDDKLCMVLNDAHDYLKLLKRTRERKSVYAKMPNYGIF